MDNVVCFYGVLASICTSVLCAQAGDSPIAGWENVGAITILGFTMYYLLNNVSKKLEKLSDNISALRTELRITQAGKEDEE